MLADLLFIFFNRKVTNLLSPEAAEKVGERNCPISGI